jgi:anionic cell wall polymer biosynthesis LytR-Cps2A-Psr (LCP) family protein
MGPGFLILWQKILENRLYTAIFLSLVFLVGLGGTYFTLVLTSPKGLQPKALGNKIQSEPEGAYSPTPLPEPIDANSAFNVALLGSGGAGHSGGTLTDSIIVVSVDPKKKKAILISVPRDLWVPGNRKINASVLAVGHENLKAELANITGLQIDKFVSIDFSGSVSLIDSIGGIEIDVPKAFADNFYPVRGLENETCGKTNEEIAELHKKYSGFELEKQFTCRYERVAFDKGKSQVDGATALKLARSRHGDSDFGRSERQFSILKGIGAKLLANGSWENIEATFRTLSKFVKTDIHVSQAVELTKVFGVPEVYDVQTFHLSEDNVLRSSKSSDGQYILVPKAGNFNFSEIKKFISG